MADWRLVRRVRQRLGRLRPTSQQQWNILWLCFEVVFSGIMQGGAASFLAIYVVRAGGTPAEVSLLAALPALVTALACLLIGSQVQRTRHMARLVTLCFTIQRAFFLLTALLPFFPRLAPPVACVALWSLAAIPVGVGSVAFSTMLAEAVPPEQRAHVISLRMVVYGLMASGTGYLSGRLLDNITFPLNYQIIFVTGFVAGVIALLCIGNIRLPDLPESGQHVLPVGQRYSLRQRLLALRQMGDLGKDWLRLEGASTWLRLGLNMPLALFSLYWVHTARASDTVIGLLGMALQFSTIVGYWFWGRIASRKNERLALVLGTVASGLYPLLTALTRHSQGLLSAAAIGGFSSAGLELGFVTVLFLSSPAEWRPQLLALDASLAYLFGFIGPMIGAALSESLGIVPALLIAAFIRTSSGLLIYALGVGRRRAAEPAYAG
jgi:MFS family permease